MERQLTSCTDKSSLGITSKRLFKEEGELWVSKRNMTLILCQRFDTESKSRQRQINLLSLLQSFPRSSSLSNPLWPSQINQIQLRLLHTTISKLLKHLNHKNSMTPAWPSILIRACNLSVHLSYLEPFKYFLWRLNILGVNIEQMYIAWFLFSHLDSCLCRHC